MRVGMVGRVGEEWGGWVGCRTTSHFFLEVDIPWLTL